MKKEELIDAVMEVRSGLYSDLIIERFTDAWTSSSSNGQRIFADTILNLVVEGAGNYNRFSQSAREICDLLQISNFYNSENISVTLHHIAEAKASRAGDGNPGDKFRNSYLTRTATILFVEAHKRVQSIANLLGRTLNTDRLADGLLLEGVSPEEGLKLESLQATLETIKELVAAYCEAQGDADYPQTRLTYLDLGSNYQIGVKIDAKAEVGVNIAKFLTEIFRWITNPRAYMRERRADGLLKEVQVFADLQKRVDVGEITPEVARAFGERLLGCGKQLADQQVFPARLIREKVTTTTSTELVKLLQDTDQSAKLVAPDFKALPPASNADSQ